MPVPGDGVPSQSSTSSSSSFSSPLRFFVRTSFRTLALHAPPNETIQNLIARIAALTRLPLHLLHLLYGKRYLPSDWTLSRCEIENDTSLQLVYSIEITRSCLPWKVVNEIITAIDDLLSIRNYFSMQSSSSIKTLIKKFTVMTPAGDDNDIMCHLQVFIYSGAHIALGKLYLSPLKFHQAVADYAIRLFFGSNFRKLPSVYYIHFMPVLLIFCKLFAGIRGKRDPLYLFCQRTIGFLLDSNGWRVFRKPKWENLVSEFYPFVVELAEEIILSLSLESFSLSRIDVTQFSYFLKALRREVKEKVGRAYPIPKRMHEVEEWIACLYKTFIKLLKKLDESLEKIENFMIQNADLQVESQLRQWVDILTVLSVCRKLGKIYEDGSDLLHGLLLARRVPLNVLIRHASRNDKYLWFLKHKDVTDFETRRSLVMMFFSRSTDVPHEMLIDRSQLLTESFMYVGPVDAHKLHSELIVEFKNEEATGSGVLREWFCLVCQAIFSPQNALFLPCPNDRRRFFPNPASLDALHLKFFSFAGRVVALALMHKIHVGITFDRVFFLQLAGKTITLEDIQDADPFLYMSCKKILDMDDEILDSDALGLTFVRETEELGSRRSIEICPGGKEIAVNSRNRKDFVTLLVQSCFVTTISEQIHHFGLGFSDMLSKVKLDRLFFQSLDLEDFDRMLGGSEDTISVEDWKAHTEYRCFRAEDQQISWFWKVVEGMQEKQKRILLCFWTSLRYLPVEGFSGLKPKLLICKALDSEDCLPSSQTCFYLLLLPTYPSISIMHDKLQLITQEHVGCTFGFC